MSELPPYFRGPLPRNVRPLKPSTAGGIPPAVEPTPAPVDRPTYWKTVANGDQVIVNPNRCMICHRRPHDTTPHHEFIADEAAEFYAVRLGWPLPPTQEHLL